MPFKKVIKRVFIVLFFFQFNVILLLGQNKIDGKLAFSIDNLDSLSQKAIGICMGYVFFEDEIVAQINIDSLLSRNTSEYNNRDYIHYYLYLPENHYTMIIEGFYSYPIIITELKIRKKKMSFLSLDFNEIGRIKVNKPHAVVLDYSKEMEKQLKKIEWGCTVDRKD